MALHPPDKDELQVQLVTSELVLEMVNTELRDVERNLTHMEAILASAKTQVHALRSRQAALSQQVA